MDVLHPIGPVQTALRAMLGIAEVRGLLLPDVRSMAGTILVMGFALYTLIAGLREGPNLAPIFVVLLAPISTPWLWIIGLLRR